MRVACFKVVRITLKLGKTDPTITNKVENTSNWILEKEVLLLATEGYFDFFKKLSRSSLYDSSLIKRKISN